MFHLVNQLFRFLGSLAVKPVGKYRDDLYQVIGQFLLFALFGLINYLDFDMIDGTQIFNQVKAEADEPVFVQDNHFRHFLIVYLFNKFAQSLFLVVDARSYIGYDFEIIAFGIHIGLDVPNLRLQVVFLSRS